VQGAYAGLPEFIQVVNELEASRIT
jgi:hypothetical protein